MPVINIDHVVSFSSEDPIHVANNVLSSDPAKKWKCQTPGERSAVVVLQLEKASVISSIDIGNENSAYIEVLVSRSGTNDDDFKVLLVMSSFMTPLDARQTTNINKVRMFTQDQLSKPECEQKWDRVKIVCTQPFNRHVKYGLSFVTFHSREAKGTAGSPSTIGQFSLRSKSPDNLSIGSLFARRKELQETPLKGAAAIRDASSSTSLSHKGSPVCKPKLKESNAAPNNNNSQSSDAKMLPRNRNELLYDKDEEVPNDRIDKIIEKKQSETKEKQAKEEAKPKKDTPRQSKEESRRKETPKASSSRESSKRKNESPRNSPNKKVKDNRPRRPFSQLLRGVTLVISGIQNPDRANLRTMALALGAKYKADWDDSCTHLICAFRNTPKFNQVKGKGKIIKKEWIEDCHSHRKRYPWRSYALDKDDAKKPESEDEIWEEVKQASPVVQRVSSDEEGFEDEMLEKIAKLQAKTNSGPYDQDTDEEVLVKQSKEISKKLSNFLENKTIFVDETLDEDICKMLKRFIIAYKGVAAENPDDDVDAIITSEDGVENLKDAHPNGLFLRPDWLWECHNCQAYVPTEAYKL